MRVKQTASFVVRSALDPDVITSRLEISPDSTRRKGLSANSNLWEISARGKAWAPLHIPGVEREEARALTAQIEEILERLRPASQKLLDLHAEPNTSSALRIVRWFFPSRDEVQLSFSLTQEVLAFLANTRSYLDVSEYDMASAPDDVLVQTLVLKRGERRASGSTSSTRVAWW